MLSETVRPGSPKNFFRMSPEWSDGSVCGLRLAADGVLVLWTV
jgi:hypothetical protein